MQIKGHNVALLLGCILLCQLAGVAGSVFTAQSVGTWYVSLNKPEFTPPGYLISIIWIALYTVIGIALYTLVKSPSKKDKSPAYWLFGAQLGLNALWSYLFFGLQSPLLGLIGIAVLWFAIIATIWAFYAHSKRAAALLVPYIAWVTFAAFLNYSVLILN
ncbi:MAG: tryptophan-rich sensory protein [Candidatus Micrarchaeota archaeon]|nr:tryptophan-rich sensory protein [Candidatus Micrarchaeota archaeon]